MTDRPVYLNLLRIHLPLPGLISFAHRVSGIALFFSIPLVLKLLEISLAGEAGFTRASAFLHSIWLMPFFFFFVWALSHHLLAGFRFLLMDMGLGLDRQRSRLSAAVVGVSAFFLTLMLMLEFYL